MTPIWDDIARGVIAFAVLFGSFTFFGWRVKEELNNKRNNRSDD